MSLEQRLIDLRDAVQIDVGNRGLARDPDANLINAFPQDFSRACHSLAAHPAPRLAVVTGFYIPAAKHGETDGPLGAVYLARTLPQLGIEVLLVSDPFCRSALCAGLRKCSSLTRRVPVLDLPHTAAESRPEVWWPFDEHPPPTHLLALERVGPAHTPESIRNLPRGSEETVRRFLAEVTSDHHDRCHTMRGVDITADMHDAAHLFDRARISGDPPVTIGIGDGGNEIGMGKVPWEVIRRNIPGGAVIACRVATDHLIVTGISNWGAYALAAGVALAKGVTPPPEWFDLEREREILECMVAEGPLVDGVSGQFSARVDGLAFTDYAEPLRRIARIARA
jgi:hypothetical protein